MRFLIVGHGDEQKLRGAESAFVGFAGVLRGEALAAAYADMDLLVFPSHTDTFGNVVLEALASGVPAVVTPDGGPKFIVRDGETGFVVADDHFAKAVAEMVARSRAVGGDGVKARDYALGCSWDAVFDRVYSGYETALRVAT